MQPLYALILFLSGPAFAQYTGSYSERSRTIERESAQQENARDIARTQQINQMMLSAAAAYAQSRGYELPRESMKCPTRREIYWYGFNVPRDDDAWSSIRYQYCEFNVGSEGCRIGMSWQNEPVRVYCIGKDGVNKTYQVTADGRVSAVSEGTGATRRRSR